MIKIFCKKSGGFNMTIILLIYMALGYWATGVTIYANKVLIGSEIAIFGRRLCIGFIFGWILIPWALIKLFL